MTKLETLRETLTQTIGSKAADAALRAWKRSWEKAEEKEAEEADDARDYDAAAAGQTHLLQSILASRPELAHSPEGEACEAVGIVVNAEVEVCRAYRDAH